MKTFALTNLAHNHFNRINRLATFGLRGLIMVSQSIQDAINDICEGDPFPQVAGVAGVAGAVPSESVAELRGAAKANRTGAQIVFGMSLLLAGMAIANGKHLSVAALIAVGGIAFYCMRRDARTLSQQAAYEAYEQAEADKDAQFMIEACEWREANRRAGFVRLFYKGGRTNG